jgi:hypothetical protein
LGVSSEVCFLLGLGEKKIPGSVAGCIENIANAQVFVRFHFFTYLVSWMISNCFFDIFLVVFRISWAHVLICEGLGCRSENH